MRHLGCHSLWVQQRRCRREFRLLKVASGVNPADLCTKHVESQAKLDQVVGLFGCHFIAGRAESAPAPKLDLAVEVNIAHDPAALPHMHLPEDIAELFEEARPESPHRGEDDLDATEELADPVPRIRAARAINHKHRS